MIDKRSLLLLELAEARQRNAELERALRHARQAADVATRRAALAEDARRNAFKYFCLPPKKDE